MSEKKGTRPDVAASERAKEPGVACRQTTNSTSDDTTFTPLGQELHIANFLSHGQENAIPLRELKNLLHLNGRTVRLMIRAERLSGTPILSDNQTGYYLPGNDQERTRCVRSMKRRAAEIVRAADAIEGAADIGE